jgi:hypothetical protein
MTCPAGSSRGPPPPAPPAIPWQFRVRALAVITGLSLLVIVDVHGAGFYLACGLIGLSLLSEAAATLVHWGRPRGDKRG